MVGGINACWDCSAFLMIGSVVQSAPDMVRNAFNDSIALIYNTPIMAEFRIHQQSRNATITQKSPIHVSMTLLPRKMRDTGLYCRALQTVAVLCKCAYESDGNERQNIEVLILVYNVAIYEVAQWCNTLLVEQGRVNEIRIHVKEGVEQMLFMSPGNAWEQIRDFNR